jgi:hypothetical protein
VLVAIGLLAWALWPSAPPPRRVEPQPAPVDRPGTPEATAPPRLVKVSFKAPPGVKITVEGTEIAPGKSIDVPPGELRVVYVCPGKRKQKPRTHNVTQQVPVESPYEMPLQCF